MPGRKPLAVPGDTAYRYDGSLSGLYTCVHACVYSGRLPLEIQSGASDTPTLLPAQVVLTDEEKARRVRDALERKVSPRARELVENVFLSCLPDKEIRILHFLLLAFEEGRSALTMLGHPDVEPLLTAEKRMLHEAHLLTGFIRFSDYGGSLLATIRPKNFALPYLAPHFIDRFSQENFMIYDRTHGAALVHEPGRSEIVRVEGVVPPEASEEERKYRALWKRFYDTIAIQARINPRCRMSHMPKRYWTEMTEMQDEVCE